MSELNLNLFLVGQIMYLQYGDVNPGDEEKVARYERKISEWKRDVVDNLLTLPKLGQPTKEEMSHDIFKLENGFNGFWCQGDQCLTNRSHWVLHESKTTCWECMHDPCACKLPLVWDEDERAYYRFFLSVDGKTKRNVWMTEPTSDIQKIHWKRKEKKENDRIKKETEVEECAEKQEKAQNMGYCCHQHETQDKEENAEKEKKKADRRKRQKSTQKVNGPDHCIHCDDDPCVFVQVQSRLAENDAIYYDEHDFQKDPVAYNSGRRKRAYQYTAFILWEGVNYRQKHYTCVEDGVRALFPPFDGKVMGYKTK